MKIIFMGTPTYASEILQSLINEESVEIVAVYTQPDKPVGRKKIITASPVKELAQKHALPVYQPVRLKDEHSTNELFGIECDYIIVAAYGQILSKKILEHAPCINLHASILPAYRGASPIQHTLLNADKTTGITAMLMDEGIDTGAILKISEIAVGEDELFGSLFDRLSLLAGELSIDVLKNFSTLIPQPQNASLASHCKKISKSDGEICFDNAFDIYNKFRAFTPWPGLFLNSGLKLKSIELIETTSKNSAGVILAIDSSAVVVGCTSGSLRIHTLQSESKNETSATAYLNGKRLKVADYLS